MGRYEKCGQDQPSGFEKIWSRLEFAREKEANFLNWPNKYRLFDVKVSATTYDQALAAVARATEEGIPGTVTHLAVHGLITACEDIELREMINSFSMVAPDGQPVRIALNLLFNTKLPSNVRGSELMLRLCRLAADKNIGIYLYGSHSHVVNRLAEILHRKFPSLQVVGNEPSIFRRLTPEEDEDLVRRINNSGAGLVFLGLGCPLQEIFAFEHQKRINSVQICVGAAFDFLSENKKMAPVWSQQYGLEWLYRLVHEPRRLWKRYFMTNSIFLRRLLSELLRLRNSNSIKERLE